MEHPLGMRPMPVLRSSPARRGVLASVLATLASLWCLPAAAEDKTGQDEMIHQLRIYEIFESNKAAFHARFRDHAARIMTGRYGFKFAAMWETRFGDRTEF